MPKKCPECGQPPAEKGLIVCDNCKVPFVEALSPTYLAPESIKQVANAVVRSPKFWVPFFTILILGYLSILKIVGHFAEKQTEKFLHELGTNTQARLDDTYKEMTNRISRELIVRYPYPMIETVPEVKREFILGHGEVLCGLGRVIMTYTPSVAAREQQWRSAE
jgi:hypothetical protein